LTDPNRRYESLPVAELTLPNGVLVRYRQRRFLPRGSALPILAKVNVAEGDRLDLISSRTYGTAEALWRICDANDTMNPTELTAPGQVGSVLIVPLPR
jgi:hypothetical protein